MFLLPDTKPVAECVAVGAANRDLFTIYNKLINVHLKLLGEHYFTPQAGNPNLHYFFVDGLVKFRPKKWKTNFELSAVLNVKSYRTFYLSANTATASTYTLPGRFVLLKVMFKI
jgi:hypothetical protein